MIVPGLRTPRITAHRWVASSDDADALRLEPLLEEVGDLLGQPLLDLQAAGVHLDDPRDLRQPDDPAARDVGDRRGPEERQQVVLAQRVERDVLDDDHLAVGDVEDRAVDEPLGVDVVAGGQLGVHPVDAARASRPGPGDRAPRRSRAGSRGRPPRPGRCAPRRPCAPFPSISDSGPPGSSPISVSISSTMRWTWLGRSVGLDTRWTPGAGRDGTSDAQALRRAAGTRRSARGGRGSRARTAAPRPTATAATPPRGVAISAASGRRPRPLTSPTDVGQGDVADRPDVGPPEDHQQVDRRGPRADPGHGLQGAWTRSSSSASSPSRSSVPDSTAAASARRSAPSGG